MDSLTQAALGAAVGHICWQNKLGQKALVAGILLGMFADEFSDSPIIVESRTPCVL